MPDPAEAPGPLGFERQYGVHTIQVSEIPAATPGPIQIKKTTLEYPFFVTPRIPSEDYFGWMLSQRGIYTYSNVLVQMSEKNTWISKARLPIFIAHGMRNFHGRHAIACNDRLIESKAAVEALKVWCTQNDLPAPIMFISCDEAVGGIKTRWDQSSESSVIGFSGGLNVIAVIPSTNTLEIINETLTGGPNPFSSKNNPQRGRVEELFRHKIRIEKT